MAGRSICLLTSISLFDTSFLLVHNSLQASLLNAFHPETRLVQYFKPGLGKTEGVPIFPYMHVARAHCICIPRAWVFGFQVSIEIVSPGLLRLHLCSHWLGLGTGMYCLLLLCRWHFGLDVDGVLHLCLDSALAYLNLSKVRLFLSLLVPGCSWFFSFVLPRSWLFIDTPWNTGKSNL